MKNISMRRLFKRFAFCLSALIFRDKSPKVIYYHDIGVTHTKMGTPFELFKHHVGAAKASGYEYVSWNDFGKGTDDCKKEILLCFDDGFRGVYDFREYFCSEGIRPLVFVAVGLVGTPGHLTWAEMAELQELGFSFQSHTWSHQTLAGPGIEALSGQIIERTDVWFEHELRDSKAVLERELGNKVMALCFPAGRFSEDALQRCHDVAYTELYTSIPGALRVLDQVVGIDGCRLIPRHLCQDLTVGEFLNVLKGGLKPFMRYYLKRHFEKEKGV